MLSERQTVRDGDAEHGDRCYAGDAWQHWWITISIMITNNVTAVSFSSSVFSVFARQKTHYFLVKSFTMYREKKRRIELATVYSSVNRRFVRSSSLSNFD